MPLSEGDALQPQLAQAQNTLKSALATACDADVDRVDTGELIRLEEVLAIANDAAKEAVSVRRRLSVGREEPTAELPDHSPVHRQVKDNDGVSWDVFAVRPTQHEGRSAVQERFREGWLTFDSGAETRRVAPIPADWERLEASELLRLCAAAETSPRRVRLLSNPSDYGTGG